jgi:hemerythrin-like metal-binding protein
MSELVWKNEYAIGHFQTDNEHKELISLSNKVVHFSNNGKDITKIRGALKALQEYTLIHFRNEEKYMEQLGYKEIDHHKQCHAELVERLNKVKLNNGHIDDLLHDLKRLMVVWVIEHIVNEDQKIAQEI